MLNKSVVNYQDQDISEKHIENEDFRFSNFDNAIIRNAYFSGCDFRDASFKHADLSHSKFHNCFLDGADFSGAMMRKMLINRCILAEANLSGADLYKTVLPNTIVFKVNLSGIKNLHNRSRNLIGELLRQHAGDSRQKLQYALSVGSNTSLCWSDWQMIADENPIYMHWAIEVFKQYPQSRLLESFINEEVAMTKEDILNYNSEIGFKVLKAPSLAILKVKDTNYVAESDGHNNIRLENIMGILLHYSIEKNYNEEEHMVDIVYKKQIPTSLENIQEIIWPYPPKKIIDLNTWEEMAKNHVNVMQEQELPIVKRILRYIKEYLKPGVSIIDPACSHGLLLQHLEKAQNGLTLFGLDISPKMVLISKNAVKNNRSNVNLGSAFEITGNKFDYCIIRAIAHYVMTREEGKKAIEAGMKNLKKGGKLIIHSASPPVLQASDIEKMGILEKKVFIDDKDISAFYVLKKGNNQ